MKALLKFSILIGVLLTMNICLFPVSGYGQDFNFKVLERDSLKTATQINQHGLNDTIVVSHDKWDEMVSTGSTYGNNFKFKSVHAFVRFSVNHAYGYKIFQPYTLRLVYKIYGYSNPSTPTVASASFNDTLTISYKPDSLATFQDKQYKKYSNFHKVMIVLTGLYKIDGAGGVPQQLTLGPTSSFNLFNFNVEGAIVFQPYYKNAFSGSYYPAYDNGGALTVKGLTPTNDYLPVAWTISGATIGNSLALTPAKYELEWTYADNYKVTPTNTAGAGTVTEIPATTLKYNFTDNATRVWLDTNYYQIPLIYQKGYVVYRVRLVRPDSVEYKYAVYGPWTLVNPNDLVSNVPAVSKYQITTAHLNDSLNWQYTVSFAEQGKYKHVMSYYDGMLKNRQSITRFNGLPNKLIATEQVYDYEGRPSISILPTPINSLAFRYQLNLSLNRTTSLPYRAKDFDSLQLSVCPADVLLPPLSHSSPADIYYSTLNPDKAGFQRFVPDAGGYPLVQTIYSPGYDERVEKQGGAGDTLQIGRSHNVKNDYVSSEQYDLNRLFGTDIGWAGFYRKTVSRDPNGQLSLNVTDYKGKTMMSAMVGLPDTMIHALVSNENLADSVLLSEDFIAGTSQQIFDNKRILDKNFFNEANGNNTAQYIYAFKPYPTFCVGKYLTIKSKYDYTIFDECGIIKAHKDSIIGTTGVVNSPGIITTMQTPPLGFYMDKGKHSLHKELTVSTDEINLAVDTFMAQAEVSDCMKTEPWFIKESVLSKQFPCPKDLEDADCSSCDGKKYAMMQELYPNEDSAFIKKKYGVYHTINGVIVGNTNSDFTLLCGPGTNPSGWYGEYPAEMIIDKSSTVLTVGNWVSSGTLNPTAPPTPHIVLKNGDTLNCKYRYQDACVVTLPASVTKYGQTYTNLQQIPVEDFINIFNNDIAAALLPLHPEYCNLLGCVDDIFIKKLRSIPDGNIAAQLGLLYLDNIIAADPLSARMQISGAYPNVHDTLAYLAKGTVSLNKLALNDAYCSTSDNNMLTGCQADMFATQIAAGTLINDFVKNRYFDAVRDLYIGNRQRYLFNLNTNGFAQGGCATCAPIRMDLIPDPVFPNDNANVVAILDSFINATSTTGAIQAGAGSSSAVISQYISLTSGINMDTLTPYSNSAVNNYASQSNIIMQAAVDSITAELVNCVSPSGNLTGLSAYLMNLYTTGQVLNLQFTPAQISAALAFNNITTDDLCNPYIVNYDGLLLPPPESDGSGGMICGNEASFVDLTSFLNGQTLVALQHVGTGYTVILGTNSFETKLKGQLGNPSSCTVVAALDAVQHLYTLTYTSGANSVKAFIKADASGICQYPFTVNAGETITVQAQCTKDIFGNFPSGYIGSYSFAVVVKHATATATTYCKLKAWNNKIVLNNVGTNPIAGCVPCTQMKTLYKQLWDTLHSYTVKGADHPYYLTMLRNFMNYNLKKAYTSGQYKDFVESCALADSMRIDRYPFYFDKNFADTIAVKNFLNYINGLDPAIVVNLLFSIRFNNNSSVDIGLDLNGIPFSKLRIYKNAITNYTTGLSGNNYSNFLSASVGINYMGTIFTPQSSPFVPDATIFANAPNHFTFELGWGAIRYWNGTSYNEPYNYYSVYSPSPGNNAQNNRDISTLQQYIIDNNLPAIFYPSIESSINTDYYLSEKQALLKYTYNYQSSPPSNVLDTLLVPKLQAGIPLFNGQLLSYGCPSNPGAIQNLYIGNPATYTNNTRFNKLQYVFSRVTSALGNSIFMGAANNTVNIPTAPGELITAYRCRDTAYWYRYFGAGDTLYNVFLKVPAYIDPALLPGYLLQEVKASLGDGDSRAFTVTLKNNAAPIQTITLNGYTDFVVAKNMVLDNVLLAHPVTEGIPVADTVVNCERSRLTAAITQGKINYRMYVDSIKNKIRGDFFDYVMKEGITEKLIVSYRNQRFNYTLYNYDRAGNLVKTVPPAGVFPIVTNLQNIDDYRSGNNGMFLTAPDNKLSTYEYNTLNQVYNQNTPDGGNTDFYYDAAGRVVFSQNAKQRPSGNMTYTLYDEQGRIIETGQAPIACTYFTPILNASASTVGPTCSYFDPVLHQITALPPIVTDLIHRTPQEVRAYVRSKDREEVVLTNYDTKSVNLAANQGFSGQENLRKRVASIKYFDYLGSIDSTFVNYTYAMHFSYDVEGNVKTLTRDYPAYKTIGQEFKRVDYDYDVISGKVNLLSYNRGFADQFYQKYAYDADNRIISVQTSNDGIIWQNDASYEYYQHGPLARMSLGDLKVQGVDYAYTIQGWLKAINGDALTVGKDMGLDGVNYASSHQLWANDAAALSLDYFKGDYKPIGTDSVTHLPPNSKNLYNGNIPRATTSVLPFADLASKYTYDQLNRIIRADYGKMTRAQTAPLTSTADYYSSYAYDPDGNLKKLVRNGNNPANQQMDSLQYYYTGYQNASTDNNKLLNVTDIASNAYSNDIKQFLANNLNRYTYDATGNVTSDLVSGQGSIIWNHYNKVSLSNNSFFQQSLNFDYDGAGNRYWKGADLTIKDQPSSSGDYYVRDAQGNILAVYKDENSYGKTNQQWIEYITAQMFVKCDRLIYIKRYIIPFYGFNQYFKKSIFTTVNTSPTWVQGQITANPVSFYLNQGGLMGKTLTGLYGFKNVFADMASYSQSHGNNILGSAMAIYLQQTPQANAQILNGLLSVNSTVNSSMLKMLCTNAPTVIHTMINDYGVPQGYQSGDCDANAENMGNYVRDNGIEKPDFYREINAAGNASPNEYKVFLTNLYSASTVFNIGQDPKNQGTSLDILCQYAPEILQNAINNLGMGHPSGDCATDILKVRTWLAQDPKRCVDFDGQVTYWGTNYLRDQFNQYVDALLNSTIGGSGVSAQKDVITFVQQTMPTSLNNTCNQYGINHNTPDSTILNVGAFFNTYPDKIGSFANELSKNVALYDNANGGFTQFINAVTMDLSILANMDYVDILMPHFTAAVNKGDWNQFYPFFDSWGSGRTLLEKVNDQETILESVYQADPAQFIANYMTANGNNSAVLTQALTAIPKLRLGWFIDNIYRVPTIYCLTTVVVDSIVHNTYNFALQYRRLSLTSHVLYGSSRLGTKDYIPGQFYEMYKYGSTQVIDTLTLSARRPWYSLEYNDGIAGLALEPYNATDVSNYYATHQIGMKQYELNNHLGNVQATITDLPHPKLTDDIIIGRSPAIAAAYDYYPFGMLMPGRYVSDTTSKCVTVTQTQWVTQTVDSCYDVTKWIWPFFEIWNGATALSKAPYLEFDCSRVASAVSFKFPSVPLVPQTLSVEVAELTSGTGSILVEEEQSGNWTTLATVNVNTKNTFTLNYQSTTSQIRLRFLGPYKIKVKTVCVKKQIQVQQSNLVDVCSGMGGEGSTGGGTTVNSYVTVGTNDFEDGTVQGWEAYGTTPTAINGRLRANILGPFNGVIKFFNVIPGHVYRFRYSVDPGSFTGGITCSVLFAPWNLIMQSSGASFVEQVVTAGSNQLILLLESNGYTASGINQNFYLDNLTLEELVTSSTPSSGLAGNFGKGYRFGFNGQEKVNEWSGIGNFMDFAFRGEDTRIGRFLSVDPLARNYPWNSTYAFAENRAIDGVDLEGREYKNFNEKYGTLVVVAPNVEKEFGAAYNAALKAKVDVVMAKDIFELNGYLSEKNKQYDYILNLNHGGVNVSYGSKKRVGLIIGSNNFYYADAINQPYASEFETLGSFIKPTGLFVALGCFTANEFGYDGKELMLAISKTTKRSVLGNQGVSGLGGSLFSNSKIGMTDIPAFTGPGFTYFRLSVNNIDRWSKASPNGDYSYLLGGVRLNNNGQVTNFTEIKNKSSNDDNSTNKKGSDALDKRNAELEKGNLHPN